MMSMIHQRLRPCFPPPAGTPGVSRLYSSQWRDWVPGSSPTPRASTCARPTRGSTRRSPSRGRWITHGHADHARGGHGAVLATPETLAIMEVRYGPQNGPGRSPMTRPSASARSTSASSPPAMCSARRRSCSSTRASGWSSRAITSAAPTRPAPASCRCRATSSSPRRPSACRCSAIPTPAARSTGCSTGCTPTRAAACWSAPMRSARRSGSSPSCARAATTTPIYFHGAIERLNQLYESFGVELGELRHTGGATKAEMAGHIVIAPPGALNDRWSRRLPDPVTAMASGWMRIRQRARQRNVELPLIISDHADWDELTMTIRELEPTEVWITHGREEALKHWCMTHQIKALRAEPGRLRGRGRLAGVGQHRLHEGAAKRSGARVPFLDLPEVSSRSCSTRSCRWRGLLVRAPCGGRAASPLRDDEAESKTTCSWPSAEQFRRCDQSADFPAAHGDRRAIAFEVAVVGNSPLIDDGIELAGLIAGQYEPDAWFAARRPSATSPIERAVSASSTDARSTAGQPLGPARIARASS